MPIAITCNTTTANDTRTASKMSAEKSGEKRKASYSADKPAQKDWTKKPRLDGAANNAAPYEKGECMA